eukprot:COSAG02_NODE_2667_length_8294_cov_305.833435_11_plen_66_part_00
MTVLNHTVDDHETNEYEFASETDTLSLGKSMSFLLLDKSNPTYKMYLQGTLTTIDNRVPRSLNRF